MILLSRTGRRRFGPAASIVLLLCLVLLSWTPSAGAQERPDAPDSPDSTDSAPTVVQPGAPGQEPRLLTHAERRQLEPPAVTEADIGFARGMIPHHRQALEMVRLIPARTDRTTIQLLGRRIAISQQDEIEFLRRWLTGVGEEPTPDHDERMPGMLTESEMEQLAEADGIAFERLFVESMIHHHRGALTMVDRLLSTPGAAQESLINQFAAEVWADQEMEIRRMSSLLEDLRGEEQ